MRALLLVLLLCAASASAAPNVRPVVEGGDNDCEGWSESERITAPGQEWRWYNATASCETRYSYYGVAVENDGEELASAGLADRETHHTNESYDYRDDLSYYGCDSAYGPECSRSRMYDNRTRNGTSHRASTSLETSHTEPVELVWCDAASSDHEANAHEHHGSSGMLLSRDSYHNESARGVESCRYGARTMGVQESVIRCDRVSSESLWTEEHYREGEGLTWDGAGEHRSETTCLYGVWRDVDAGIVTLSVRVGYEEVDRDCYPACGPTHEENLAVGLRATPDEGDGVGVDERVPFSAPLLL